MTEQQNHLKQAIENQRKLISEIGELNDVISVKKEAAIKYQGVIEYLTQSGVELPKETTETSDTTEEV